jgi:hypothetical protein
MCRATKLRLPGLPPSPPMVHLCGVVCRHRDRKIGPTPFLWAAAVCGKNLPVKGDERQGARFSASRGGKVFVRTDQSRPSKHHTTLKRVFSQTWRTIRVLLCYSCWFRSIAHHQSRFVPTCGYIRLIRVTLLVFQCVVSQSTKERLCGIGFHRVIGTNNLFSSRRNNNNNNFLFLMCTVTNIVHSSPFVICRWQVMEWCRSVTAWPAWTQQQQQHQVSTDRELRTQKFVFLECVWISAFSKKFESKRKIKKF